MAARTSPKPSSPDCARQAGRVLLAFTMRARRQAPIKLVRRQPKRANSRRSWLFGGSKPRSNRCRPRGDRQLKACGQEGQAPADLSSKLHDLPRTQGPPLVKATSDDHSTQAPFGPGSAGDHSRLEEASSFRSERSPVRRRQAQGLSNTEGLTRRRRPSLRGAWYKALSPSPQGRTPAGGTSRPPSLTDRSPKGPETRRRMDSSASVCKTQPNLKHAVAGASSRDLALSVRPTRLDTRPSHVETRTLRDRAGALAAERPALAVDLEGEPPWSLAQAA
jgi:hypothetical protein